MLLAGGAAICAPMLVFQAGTFFTHYAADHLGYSTNLVLTVSVLGGFFAIAFAAASAISSDMWGRKRVTAWAVALAVPWSVAVFPLIETRDPVVFGVSMVTTYALIGACMGPMAAFLPELFAARYRYTAAALSHTIGAIVGGALPPVLSPALLNAAGSTAVAAMMGALALLSFACVAALPETAGRRATRR